MKNNKRVFILGLILTSFLLGACGEIASDSTSTTSQTPVSQSSETSTPISSSEEIDTTLLDAKSAIQTALPTHIDADYIPTLPAIYSQVTLQMTSSHPEILTNQGVYTRPENDTNITLTITLTYQEEQEEFSHTLLAKGRPVSEKLAAVAAELILATEVDKDFVLPSTTLYNPVITWSSSDASYISISGNNALVNRPQENMTDELVTLTATIEIGGSETLKNFPITVKRLTVTSIQLTSPFTTSYYPVGSGTFDATGGKLNVVLDDETSKEVTVTSGMISDFDTTSTGEKVVTITYYEASTNATIYVYQPAQASELELDESKLETFEDEFHPLLSIDNAQTPNSTFVGVNDGALNGNRSLYFESAGSYKTLFLANFVSMKANQAYRITFKYKLLSFVDTIYFQIAGPNVFTQFGGANDVNTVKTFEWIYSSGQDSALIQIFPGGSNGVTSMIIDDFKIEHVYVEENTVISTLDVNSSALETFGDFSNKHLNVDFAPAPASRISNEGAIDGFSLILETNGSYSGIYMTPKSGLLPVGNYKITFEYKVTSMVDTLYFQFYNNGAVGGYTQFGNPSIVNQVQEFEFDFTLTTQVTVFHIFPGGGSGLTLVVIDNLTFLRLAD